MRAVCPESFFCPSGGMYANTRLSGVTPLLHTFGPHHPFLYSTVENRNRVPVTEC